jgi:hypothetical protein
VWGVGTGTASMCMSTPLMMAAYGGSDAAVRCLIMIAEHGVGIDSLSAESARGRGDVPAAIRVTAVQHNTRSLPTMIT